MKIKIPLLISVHEEGRHRNEQGTVEVYLLPSSWNKIFYKEPLEESNKQVLYF